MFRSCGCRGEAPVIPSPCRGGSWFLFPKVKFRCESEGHGAPYLSEQVLFALDLVLEDPEPSYRKVCVWCVHCALWVVCGHAFHVREHMHPEDRVRLVGSIFAFGGPGNVNNAYVGQASNEGPQNFHHSFLRHLDPLHLFG